jgi:hypothetical protein
MYQLRILKGKFIKGGVEVAPEFGNVEQINCLKKFNERLEQFKEGLEVDVDFILQDEDECTFDAILDFKCSCLRNIESNQYDVEEDDVDCFVGECETCMDCGNEYKFSNERNYLVVKLINKYE